jgi:hypothetical protein
LFLPLGGTTVPVLGAVSMKLYTIGFTQKTALLARQNLHRFHIVNVRRMIVPFPG